MCIETAVSVEDSTKLDMFYAQSDFLTNKIFWSRDALETQNKSKTEQSEHSLTESGNEK